MEKKNKSPKKFKISCAGFKGKNVLHWTLFGKDIRLEKKAVQKHARKILITVAVFVTAFIVVAKIAPNLKQAAEDTVKNAAQISNKQEPLDIPDLEYEERVPTYDGEIATKNTEWGYSELDESAITVTMSVSNVDDLVTHPHWAKKYEGTLESGATVRPVGKSFSDGFVDSDGNRYDFVRIVSDEQRESSGSEFDVVLKPKQR